MNLTVEAPTQTHLLSRTPESVRAARSWSVGALEAWGLSSLSDDAALAVSELATNAVKHPDSGADPGSFRIDITLISKGVVRIAVHDHSETRPVFAEDLADENAEAEGGRGLLIVATVSDACGVKTVPSGKIVWCTLSIEARTD